MMTSFRRNPFRTILFFILLSASMPAWAKAPDWVPDPANSRWVVFGGKTGIAESQGIDIPAPQRKTTEGELIGVEVGNLACGQSVRPDGKMGYYYLAAEPWDQFEKWLGKDRDVLLTIRYYDWNPGNLHIKYDSSDPRVRHDPYPAGVWRVPEEYSNGVPLQGEEKWKTVSMRLPLAFFAKRCHGADIRLDPLTENFALAGVAITRVPKETKPPPEVKPAGIVTQELRMEKTQGLVSFGKGARFAGAFVQEEGQPIVMEAELATSLAMADGRAPGIDPEASGGAYIHFVDSAEWKFTVKTPGKYVVWERAFFPWKGGWNHDENMDQDAGGIVMDGTRTPEEGWQWLKGREYPLKKGEHRFRLSYCGGARLDVLVLSPDASTPPDMKALKSSYRGPVTGEIWTTAVTPFDVKKWESVKMNLAGQAQRNDCEISTDDGKTWKPFDPQTGRAACPAAGGGKDSLRFHLKLQGAEGGTPPLFGGGTVSYVPGPHSVKVVENARVKVEVDPYGIKSILDKKTGAPIAEAAELHDALAMIVLKKPGPASTFTQDLYNGTLEELSIGGSQETPVLTMTHRLASGVRLLTTMKLLPSGQLEWQLKIDNPTDLEVAEVRFPTVNGIRLGGNPEDDWIFMAKCWGQVWQNPSKEKRLSAFWGPSMRWSALWDDRQGFYLGIEDPKFEDCAFVCGGDSSGGTTLAPVQRILAKPKGSWTSGIYRMAVTGGDWHEGADIYRAYVGKALKPCAPPLYVKWLVDMWCTQDSNYTPLRGWDVIEPTAPHLMGANRQMIDGADSGYCGLYPFPCLAWGSVREFSQKLAMRRALGGFYTPYHNFHLWSPGYGHYDRIGSFPKGRLPSDTRIPNDEWYARAAAYSYTGSYSRMEQDYFAQLDMAMGSSEWRDWLMYWTDKYLGWGADGMYYDQFNMIYPNGKLYPDFNTYGCWMPATLDVFAKMKRASRAKNPYYTSSGEVCNDVYGQYLDLHMTSGVFNRLDFYTYCNPNQLLLDGGWNGGLAATFGGWERERFIWQVGARFEQLIGPKGAYNAHGNLGSGDPVGDEWTAQLLQLRRAAKGLLYGAQFMDTVGLVVRDAKGARLAPEHTFAGPAQNAPCRGVIGRWFLCTKDQQRGAVVNLINAASSEDGKTTRPVQGAVVSIDTKAFGPVRSAVAWTLDGKREVLKGTQQGDRYEFPVPEAELASVVLANQLAPVVEWSLDPVTTPGLTRQLALKIANPNGEEMSGTIVLRPPPGWKAPKAAKFGPVAPDQSITVNVPVTVPTAAKPGRQDVFCDIQTPQGTFSTYSFAVVNPPLIADFRGDPGRYHVWIRNLDSETASGSLQVTAPEPLKVSAPVGFKVPPNDEIEVPVTVAGRDQLKENSEMKALLTIGKRKIEVVRGVMSLVPNGDFETDTSKDHKPDWWMCRKKGDEWSYERMHLAEGAHGGKYCLRLDPPQKDEEFICAYPVNGALKPQTRHRVSIWIKSASPKGVVARIGGVQLGEGKTRGEWQEFSADFTTGKDLSMLYRTLYNYSDQPAYFDNLKIQEME